MELNKNKGISIFLRIVVVFMTTYIAVSGSLIFIAYTFSVRSIEKRTKETISQQVAIMRDNFEKQYGANLKRSIRGLVTSQTLDDYLQSSRAEKLILSKRLERLFLRTVADFQSYHSIHFVSAAGDVPIRVVGKTRRKLGINLKRGASDDAQSPLSLQAAIRLFGRLESTPLLLSSGYMEWFMPPRDVEVEGPFIDEAGKVSSLAGMSKLDLDTGMLGGIIMIRQNLDAFFRYVRSVTFFDENPIWVFDASGRILQQPNNPDATFDPSDVLPQAFQGAVQLLDTEKGLVALQDFSIAPGQIFIRIAVSIPLSLLHKDMTPALRFFSFILVGSLIIVFLVALYVSRYLSSPIVELAAAAARLAQGDLHTEVDIHTTGEVQTLVNSFNHMTKELRETMAFRDASEESLVREVTERKRIGVALREAKEAAESASRAKSEFLATMSHEIRTPMNGVLGMTELLAATALTDRQHHFVDTVRRSGETLLALINDILDFSKIEAGKLALDYIDFDLRDLVEELGTLCAERAHRKGLELVCVLEEATPVAVRGDPTRLRQILLNLLSNAIKFTEEGEIVVRVAVVDASAENAMLHFGVQDTGIGIAAEVQSHLFDAFTQADSSTTRGYGGTGLGLSIAKQLSEMMGGTIGVESVPGQGSTFWFTARLGASSATKTDASGSCPDLHNLRVLIVDDNATNREILHHQVMAWDMQNSSTEGGVQALDLLRVAAARGEPFELAILDMDMPGMDGLQLAQAIKLDSTVAAVRLVMLTSVGFYGDRDEAQQADIAAYLNKPVRQSQLYDTLITVMSGASKKLTPQASVATQISGETGPFAARILLAEDNPVNQEVAELMLESLGCQIDCVTNGQDAVETLAHTAYDLVLMDCEMPVMDGFEATKALRTREAAQSRGRLPIIALTAHALEGNRELCLADGMDDYLSKPFTLEQLSAILERWLPRRDESLVHPEIPLAPTLLPEVTQTPTLDPTVIATLETLPNGVTRLASVLRRYLETAPTLMSQLHRAVEQGDDPGIRQAAHSLKGSSATVGALRLAELSQGIEAWVNTASPSPISPSLVQLEAEWAAVRSALNARLGVAGSISSEAEGAAPPSTEASVRVTTLLLVDDEPVNLEVCQGILEPMGHRLLTATNGREAIDLMDQDPPDVLLLDLMMPEMNGFEVCQHLKACPQWQSLSIIVLSALHEATDYARALDCGADDFLTKPVNAAVLQARVRNVLHRKRAEDALQTAKAAADAANQAKSMFLANMSHELRTPMHGILSFADLGLERVATAPIERLQNYFQKIGKSGHTLLALLDNLLDLAKLEAGKTVFSFEPTDLRRLASQVVEELDACSSERDLTLEVLAAETLPEVVLDAEKLQQVCRTFLSNAIKFSPQGGTITCRLHHERGTDTVVMTISNEGVGIPEDERNTIFDQFAQSSKTRTGAGGTGLRLAICREIVAGHGGRIWAENRSEGGAIFGMELPVQQANRTCFMGSDVV